MHPAALHFVRRWLAVVVATFFTVMLAAFVSVPVTLGYAPGDPAPAQDRHMT
jgi:hypothetical protein